MNLDWSAQAAHDALRAGSAVLIDVREPMEFAAERIHGALNFPLSTFDAAALPRLNGQTFVFQCGSGKRSMSALTAFQAKRSDPAANLSGGIGGWKASDLPTIRLDPATGKVLDSEGG